VIETDSPFRILNEVVFECIQNSAVNKGQLKIPTLESLLTPSVKRLVFKTVWYLIHSSRVTERKEGTQRRSAPVPRRHVNSSVS